MFRSKSLNKTTIKKCIQNDFKSSKNEIEANNKLRKQKNQVNLQTWKSKYNFTCYVLPLPMCNNNHNDDLMAQNAQTLDLIAVCNQR